MKQLLKKGIASTLAIAALFSFCACGSNADKSIKKKEAKSKNLSTQEGFTKAGAYEVSIDGKVIQLPCPLSEFTDLGFDFADDAGSQELENEDVKPVTLFRGEEQLTICVHNKEEETVRYDEGMVIAVILQGQVATEELYGGIGVGSTQEEVIAVFGDDYYCESGSVYRLEYGGGFYKYINFNLMDGKVASIAMYAGLEY